MLQLFIAGLIGFFVGYLLKHSIFKRNNGLELFGLIVLCLLSFTVLVIGLSIFAELQLGYDKQPAWVGLTAGWFTGGLYFGSKRSKDP